MYGLKEKIRPHVHLSADDAPAPPRRTARRSTNHEHPLYHLARSLARFFLLLKRNFFSKLLLKNSLAL